MRSPRSISLYTGAGGLDLGMEAAGFENAVAVEMDPAAVRTLTANRHRWGEIVPTSIHDLLTPERKTDRHSARRLLEIADLKEGEADLLVGGPPCQPFSKSGYWAHGEAKRLNDPRAKTLKAYLDVLEGTLPTTFLLENVPGLAFTDKDEGLEYLRKRITEINKRRKVSYSFCASQLNAAAYGVPQIRERVFVVGHREGREFVFPSPTHTVLRRGVEDATRSNVQRSREGDLLSLQPGFTAWDAIGNFQDDDDPRLLPRGRWAPVLATIPEGANYLWHTSRGHGLALWGWRTRYWSMLLKLAKARPSWTLTAQPGPAIGPFHWRNRRLSVRELAGLQTLPADYVIVGDMQEAQRQIGNAVPSALAEVLGRAIRSQLLEHRGVQLRPTLLPQRRLPVPPPDTPQESRLLPANIRALAGHKADHPGTGRGPGARARKRRAA